MTLKLYGVLKSRASRPFWLLTELGVPFEQIPVIQAYRLADPMAPDAPFNTASPAFRAINPNGLIPTLDDDGLVLHESLAITLYSARKFGGPLAAANAREDGLITMWTLWAATECEPRTHDILRHRRDLPPEERKPEIADAAIEALRRPFAVLSGALQEGNGALVGGRFTVADLNLAEVLRYAQPAAELFAEFPVVNRWIEACQARPAFKTMWAARVAEPH
ncbi:MAG TPA: glutathione S-transferase family protein [Rhizomicrobium sp.]|jgi:glutathione S-transferase